MTQFCAPPFFRLLLHRNACAAKAVLCDVISKWQDLFTSLITRYQSNINTTRLNLTNSPFRNPIQLASYNSPVNIQSCTQ